ncbi:hypothetical protein TanjilG_08264 [Lupinus angustifolius]|uniref:RNase H type-1 domain-containing protein n=1 Tax=Lupinus angustifolius TaxID=3871 RepID=A0A1J7HEM6_LUPAN|nr:hypothetical protein TanjilG_08264 [Lupinus angustifolius]
MVNLQCTKPNLGAVWNLVFGIAVDSIWRCRNRLIFENIDSDWLPLLYEIAAKCSSTAKDLQGLNQAIIRFAHPNNPIIRWVLPEIGWIKLNTDGAFSSSRSLAASGGVVRDHHGAFFFCLLQANWCLHLCSS